MPSFLTCITTEIQYMIRHMIPSEFEWDEAKAEANLAKHGIPFEAAVVAFDDADRLLTIDDRFDYGEERWNLIGIVDGVLLTISYTMRGDVCRIISARSASRKEREAYASHSL